VTDAGTVASESCLIDGGIVALDPKGTPSLQALQNRAMTNYPIVFYAFDLLSRDGIDSRNEPLSVRRMALGEVVTGSKIRLSSVRPGSAEQVVAAGGPTKPRWRSSVNPR